MTTIAIQKINETHVKLISDESSIYGSLSELFAFRVKGYQHQPKYKAGLWDGFIRLFNAGSKRLPQGLVGKLVKYCKSSDITILNDGVHIPDPTIDIDVKTFVESLNLSVKNKVTGNMDKIEIRDYQLDSVLDMIRNQKYLGLSPTSSGKSLILYMAIRYIQYAYGDKKPILLLVPSKTLVEQMYSDFEDYSRQDTEWDVSENVQKIHGDYSKDIIHSIVVSTWQSQIGNVAVVGYFNQFMALFIDEVHQAKGKSISSIVESATHVKYKIGVTGTLSGAYTDEMILTGLFASPSTVTTTKALMDDGKVADLAIKLFQLDYSDDLREQFKLLGPLLKGNKRGPVKYQDEIDYLCGSIKRNKFLANYSKALSGNTLMLVNKVETHGKVLYEYVTSVLSNTGRNVYYIDGSVKVKERERIRQILETETDAVLVATYGTLSTGVSIKNLHNVMFCSPSKSAIRVLQSIGRVLRMSDTKASATLHDFCDNLTGKNKKKNHTMDHALARVMLYAEAQMNYRILTVPFK